MCLKDSVTLQIHHMGTKTQTYTIWTRSPMEYISSQKKNCSNFPFSCQLFLSYTFHLFDKNLRSTLYHTYIHKDVRGVGQSKEDPETESETMREICGYKKVLRTRYMEELSTWTERYSLG